MRKWLINPAATLIFGGLLGIFSKWLDVFAAGNRALMLLEGMFSGFAVWALLGVLIVRFSSSVKMAMLNIFPFCVGMLITYYTAAELWNAVYGWAFIKGWAAFSLLSPVFAYITWRTRERGPLPRAISVGIVLGTAAGCWLLQHTFYLTDFLLVPGLAALLFLRVPGDGRNRQE